MLPQKQAGEENLSAEERAEIEEAWVQESLRRMAELESGKTKGIPAAEVHQYINMCIQKARQKS